MTTEKAIAMIEEYLLEPNNIAKEWIVVLELCKKALEREQVIERVCKLDIERFVDIIKRTEGLE